jgi:hypothetical protein
MSKELIDLFLFVGMGLYFANAGLFFFLFTRTLRTTDGIGLDFLRMLTFAIFIGSVVITIVRFCNLYVEGFNADFGRAIAIINPLTLLGVGLYLNYLFHKKCKEK